MRRLTAVIVPTSSLSVWLITMAFWAVSYGRPGTGWHVTYGSGAVCLFHLAPATSLPYATDVFDHAPEHSVWRVWETLRAAPIQADHGQLGFRVTTATADRNEYNSSSAVPFTFTLVEVPFWFPAAETGTAAAALTRFGRRWAQGAAGRCAACGYDLRGSPGRCPECGTVPGVDATGGQRGQSPA